MKRSHLLPAALLGLALLGASLPTTPAQAAVTQTGTFHPVTASRLLDTRKGTGAPKAPIGAGKTITLQVAGKGSVPSSGASAVVLNFTATNATATSGYLAAYPSDKSRGASSTLNFGKGRNTATSATVPLSADGKITIYNSVGSTDVLADLAGWYAGSSQASGGTDYLSTIPTRLLDTRKDVGEPLPSLFSVSVPVDFGGTEANSDVRALAVNLTAVNGQRTGFLTAWDGRTNPPTISALNFEAKTPIANSAVVRTRPCGSDCDIPNAPTIEVFNGSQGSVDVIVDIVGYYSDSSTQDPEGMRFTPITPTRIASSGRGGPSPTPLTPKETRTISASKVANDDTIALVTNLTALSPTATTFFTAWVTGDRPITSTLNAPKGRTVSNGANVDLTTANTFQLYNQGGTTHFAVDVTGTFEFAPYPPPASASALSAKQRAAAAAKKPTPMRAVYAAR